MEVRPMDEGRDVKCLKCGESLHKMGGCRHTYGSQKLAAELDVCTGNMGSNGKCLKCGLPMCPCCGLVHMVGFCRACKEQFGVGESVMITSDAEDNAVSSELALSNLLAQLVEDAVPIRHSDSHHEYRVRGDLIDRLKAILNQA